VVPARRQLLGQRTVHEAWQEEAGEQDEVPRPGAIFVVDEAKTLVGEAADAGLSHAGGRITIQPPPTGARCPVSARKVSERGV